MQFTLSTDFNGESIWFSGLHAKNLHPSETFTTSRPMESNASNVDYFGQELNWFSAVNPSKEIQSAPKGPLVDVTLYREEEKTLVTCVFPENSRLYTQPMHT